MTELPPILDACCGPRMMWFDRHDARTLFVDNRCEVHPVDVGTPGTVGRSPIVVAPDELVDFTSMPFADESFHMVVFDPPHVERKEMLGAVTRRFGVLNGDWREMLREGFAECFRGAEAERDAGVQVGRATVPRLRDPEADAVQAAVRSQDAQAYVLVRVHEAESF